VTSEGVDGPELDVTDAALIEAHLAGDPDAFGQLFGRHRDRLWAVALRTTGHPEDAADALQDALISAFRRADSYRGEAAVTTWLHRIVVNACLDRLRRRKVRAADPLPDDLDEAAARGAVLASPDQGHDPGPEAHAVAAERRAQVLDALEQLPPDQKAALVLVDMEGYPVAQAASILEVPTGTVKSRCARGRSRLAVLLADLGPPGTRGLPGASHSGGPPGDPPTTRSTRRHERAVEGGEQA
jgi:RNA polymerase sigma-70 factor (ECF subfamily)